MGLTICTEILIALGIRKTKLTVARLLSPGDEVVQNEGARVAHDSFLANLHQRVHQIERPLAVAHQEDAGVQAQPVGLLKHLMVKS